MRPVIVLYDADCGFCAWSASAILRLGRMLGRRACGVDPPTARR